MHVIVRDTTEHVCVTDDDAVVFARLARWLVARALGLGDATQRASFALRFIRASLWPRNICAGRHNEGRFTSSVRHRSCAVGGCARLKRRAKEVTMVSRRTTPQRSELLAQRAGTMRVAPTVSEQFLWRALRGSRLGVSFKRQVPLGGRFIVDFLASRAKLVVEVDGTWHARRAVADAARDRALARLGYRVLRLEAELVVRDMPEALHRIRNALTNYR